MQEICNEQRVIEAVLAGEHEAFRHLVERHQARIYRTCHCLLNNAELAQDLTQETFVTAYRKLKRFNMNKGSFAVWLLTIARRLCYNERRKKKPLSLLNDELKEEVDSVTPEHRVSCSETFAALELAFERLSEDQRRAFVFSEIEELSHDEIARIEGVAKGTVKSRVSRAKQFLQGILRNTYRERIGL